MFQVLRWPVQLFAGRVRFSRTVLTMTQARMYSIHDCVPPAADEVSWFADVVGEGAGVAWSGGAEGSVVEGSGDRIVSLGRCLSGCLLSSIDSVVERAK